LHWASPRAARPFVRLNCAALSETLLESELFGHEKGAFTGAERAKSGLLESAEGGTVFFDEVGEMPMATQIKLLRVLEERKVLRVGAVVPRAIDVRVVAATNRDLRDEVARGIFRQDLYFRLNGISLLVPPLRERVTEIAPLARLFAARAAAQTPGASDVLSDEAIRLLEGYLWPGNVRELRNVIERAVVFAGGEEITPAHLPAEITYPETWREEALFLPPVPSGRTSLEASTGEGLRGQLEALERQRIIDALRRCAGNQSRAADLLGIPRRTFVAKLKLFDIPRPRGGTAR
jgi:two-component system, NtrC family, response regulator AtoC